MKERIYEGLYLIWAIYVTVAVLVALVKNPGITQFLLAIFVWAVMLVIPGVIRGKW